MDYISEEFILQNIALIIFSMFILVAMVNEYFNRQKDIDEITKFKLKKLYKFAYTHFFNRNKKLALQYIKDVHKKNLVNEKYDLIRGF